MQVNGATALIHALEDEGVTQVFGLPGVQNIEIYDALLASNIKHVLARHEQAAVHMADGYARATGKVGVVLVTSGPGATNTVTGIATAYMDSVPLLVITGQVPTNAIGTDAFQEADITTITLPITKHSYLIKNAEELVPSLCEAFYLAKSGRPGPILIDVPGNVARAELEYTAAKTQPSLASYKPTIKGNARQVSKAAELIAQAKNPILLAGGGVVSSQAHDKVRMLARHQGLPVLTTMLAKGVLNSEDPLWLGQPGVYGIPQANKALQEADLVIAVGTRFSERVTGNAQDFAPQAQIIHVDIDPAEIGKNIRVDVPIVGDVATVLDALDKSLEQRAKCRGEKQVFPAQAARTTLYKTSLVCNTTHRVFSILNELLVTANAKVIITTDVGQHQLWASHLLDVDMPRSFLTSGGLGTMGFGLPAALGAQVAYPESLVLCISGDGSFQMSLQEMATVAAQNMPIKVAVINNQSHGLVRQWQELFFDKRYAHTLLSTLPNYEKLAQAYGWQGKTVEAQNNEQALKKALRWLLRSKGPALLEIIVPTADILQPMVRPGASLTEVI